MYKDIYVYQLMGVFCDKLKFGSTAALDCRTGQNKGRYHEKQLLLLLVLLIFTNFYEAAKIGKPYAYNAYNHR